MQKLDGVFDWFKCHKAALGMTLASIAGIVAGAGTIYKNDELVHAAAVIGLIATALSGGGMMKSDDFYRDRKEVLETKVDRRAPRTGATIPPVDLKKLEAKVEDKKPEPPYREVP